LGEEKKNKIKKRTLLQKTVNVFLYAGIVLLGLFLILFPVTQTSFFKDKLKNFIVEKVNESINGKISIGKLDGTVFTTVILDNTVISSGQDTVLKAQRIEVMTSPLAIFLKMIHVREVLVSNADIRLVKDSVGQLNLSKLIKLTHHDTTSSSFPFKIVVSDLALKNVSFSLQNYKNINNYSIYDSLNLENFQARNVNLNLVAVLDIPKDDFKIDLHNLSFTPNLTHFDLKEISGKLSASKTGLEADGLKILTANSKVNLSAQMKGYNVFGKFSTSEFKKARVIASVNADVNLQDLGDFVSVFKNSYGYADVSIKVSGVMRDISVNDLQVNYLNTHLNTRGRIYNLDSPKELQLKMNFYNSMINQPDVVKLLPDQRIPNYENLGVVKIDTLDFDGAPANFFARIYLVTPSGNLYIKGKADFENPLINYDLNFATTNFNLLPIIGLQTRITSTGQLIGQGSNPQNLKTVMSFTGDGSIIDGIITDSLRLSVNADKKNILYNLKINSDTSSALLSGIFDFTDEKSPGYDIEAKVKNLDYSKVFKDTENHGNFNFYVNGTGQNFDPDKLNLYLSMIINKSIMNGVKIDSSEATFNIISSENDLKSVKITSDLADITLNGKFSLPKTILLLVGETKLLTDVTNKKIAQITGKDTLITKTKIIAKTIKTDSNNIIENSLFNNVDQDNEFTFDVKFKDFKLISIFLSNSSLEVDGSVKGKVYNSNDSVYVVVNSNLEYVKFWGPKDVFFLSKLNLGFNFANSFYAENLNDISAKVDINTRRVYTGSDIHNFLLNLSLNKSKARINFSGGLENYLHAILQGDVDLTNNEADFDLDSLGIVYNDFDIFNRNNLKFTVSENEINIDNFEMIRNQASLKLKGNLLRYGNQNLEVKLSHFRGKDLSANFAELNTTNSPVADVNLSATVNGNYSNPVINMKLNVDSVAFRNNYLGYLTTDWKYEDRNLNLDAFFLDSLHSKTNPLLKIWGSVPVDLSFIGAKERLIDSKSLDLNFMANEFNLSVFGDMIPQISKARGFLSADLNVKGNWSDPEPHGYLAINKARFIAVANNLEYNSGLKLSIDGHSVSLDSLLVQNVEGTENGGTLVGNGSATLENFDLTSSQIYLNGQLKILSEASKAASPQIYGDLVVATNGKLEFSVDPKGAYLKAPINVVSADLTFPQAQRGYKNTYSNFIYRYVQDTTKVKKKELDFESLIALSQQRTASASVKVSPASKSKFDYTIDASIKKEAKIKFILDQEYNQVLTTVLKGNFKFQQIGGRNSAIGDLKLMDGSTLDFLTKTFQAQGSLRFENDLTNPYLDIVATYTNYYYPPTADSAKTSGEVEVAVKLKLKGPLKDLGKSFINNSDNLAVYYGSDNIENDIPDKTKTASDAVTFILTGQFLAAQGGFASGSSQNNALTGTASSLAGSLLGGFLNSYAGDYVRSLELRQVGGYTKFNLSGKVNNFRYTIGGTTDVFSDISRANVKIEYPFFQKLFLRLERKEALTETNNTSEMINELGLKYQFEF
jgi:hypothetical protein